MREQPYPGDGGAIHLVNPEQLGPPVGFSHVAITGGLAWIAGQTAADPAGHISDCGDLVAQFELAIKNLGRALAAVGCRPEDVIKVTYYVTDVPAYRANLEPIGQAYRALFGRHFPAATLIGVACLFDSDAMVEIDCVARAKEVPE